MVVTDLMTQPLKTPVLTRACLELRVSHRTIQRAYRNMYGTAVARLTLAKATVMLNTC